MLILLRGVTLYLGGMAAMMLFDNWDILRNVLTQTLLHSLWEAGLIAVILGVLLRLIPTNKVERRYGVLLAGLAVIVAATVVTGAILWQKQIRASQHHSQIVNIERVVVNTQQKQAITSEAANKGVESISTWASGQKLDAAGATGGRVMSNTNKASFGQNKTDTLVEPLTGAARVDHDEKKAGMNPSLLADQDAAETSWVWQDWALGLWGIGVSVMLLRRVRGTTGVQRLVRSAKMCDDEQWINTVMDLCGIMRVGRKVTVMVCDGIQSPAVVGVGSAILLLPPAVLMGVSGEQMRVIVAHELAHVKRWDYAVNLVQMVIEACLFFNPAVWWVSSRIRAEREACCDMAAVRVCGGQGEGGEETVAQTLIESARMILNGAMNTKIAQGFDGGDTDELKDRVGRLVRPRHAISGKVSTKAFLGIVVLCGLGLIVASLSMNHAVDVAVKLMSPQERQEKMTELAAEYVEPEYSDSVMNDSVQWTIRVQGDDGMLIPLKDIRSDITIRNRNYTLGTGFGSCNDDDSAATVIEDKLRAGRTTIVFDVDGYAPKWLGPTQTKPGDVIEPIVIEMERGFSSKARFIDEDGEAIKGLSGQYYFQSDDVNANSRYRDFSLNDNGIMEIEHAPVGDYQMVILLDWEGYQKVKPHVRLVEDEVVDVVVNHAATTRGRVLDGETGLPINHAKVMVVYEDGHGIRDWRTDYNRKRMRHFTTNKEGLFELNQLADGKDYAIAVEADGYGYQLVELVRAGSELGDIKLDKPIVLSGVIKGDLSLLSKNRKDQAVIQISNSLRIKSASYSHGYTKDVIVEIGEDGVGRFTTERLLQNNVTISAGDTSWQGMVHESRDDIELILGEKANTPVKEREVVVKFIPPEGWPEATGRVRIDYWKHSGYRYTPYGDRRNGMNEVVNGEVKFRVPLNKQGIGKFSIRSGEMVGYWFERYRDIDVREGVGAYEYEVKLKPGGEIYGEVFGLDGEVFNQFNLTILTIKRSNQLSENHIRRYDYANDALHEGNNGKFRIGPLPMNGVYRVSVSDASGGKEAKTISGEITLNEKNPIANIKLQFKPGKRVTVRVVDEEGKGLPNVPIQLSGRYKCVNNHGFSGITNRTGPDGRYVYGDLNPGVADYTIETKRFDDYIGQTKKLQLNGREMVIVMEKGLTVKGKVIDVDTGKAAQGCVVRLHPDWNIKDGVNRPQINNIMVNHDGEFEIRGVIAGQYYVYFDGGYDQPFTKYSYNQNGWLSRSYGMNDLQSVLIDKNHLEFEVKAKKAPIK